MNKSSRVVKNKCSGIFAQTKKNPDLAGSAGGWGSVYGEVWQLVLDATPALTWKQLVVVGIIDSAIRGRGRD